MLFTNGIPILPALKAEHIAFSDKRMNEGLNLLIVNLMPVKEDAESQLLRLFGQTDHSINVDFIYPVTHQAELLRMNVLSSIIRNLMILRIIIMMV